MRWGRVISSRLSVSCRRWSGTGDRAWGRKPAVAMDGRRFAGFKSPIDGEEAQIAEKMAGQKLLRGPGRRARQTQPTPGGELLLADQNRGEWVRARFGKAVDRMAVAATESVFSQFKNPAYLTPITACSKELAEIPIHRAFRTGPRAVMRQGISTDTPKDGLQDGADNLPMGLQDPHFQARVE